MDWQDDFTYYYLQGDQLVGCSASEVPDEYFDDSCKIYEAVRFVQQIGCQGRSQHVIHSEYHRCCLAVLKMAVEKYGQTFPVVLRGCSGSLPLEEHKILFGTTDLAVAEFYGQVQEFCNIKGLLTRSVVLSVATGGFECDEEIIFFP